MLVFAFNLEHAVVYVTLAWVGSCARDLKSALAVLSAHVNAVVSRSKYASCRATTRASHNGNNEHPLEECSLVS
ncbi:unnamed protein product [Peronospora destructor]|uniref:Secreted protein n=1 Tax=Peronospora destructor TaxID=86335 RepID=A0AAV0T7Z1_9STRA|nr:unnamed protein product [Peronospora destructor]